MSTLESTLRETEVNLSDRQKRICSATARLAGAVGRLNGIEAWMPEGWREPECRAALEKVCARIDSLQYVLPVPRDALDLSAHLEKVAALPEFSDALAPLSVACGDIRAGRRAWFLTVGAARCDVIGLEQLVRQWAECMQGVARSATAPGLSAVQRALARAAESAEARAAAAYWNRHFDEADPLDGPFEPRTVAISLPPELLEKVSKRYAVGARTVLVAAWIVLLSRITGSSQVALWQRFDGRLAPELREFVGCLCHYLPLTQRVRWTAACTGLIRDVERTLSMHERLQDSFSLTGRAPSALPRPDLQCAIRESGSERFAHIVRALEGGEPFRLRLSAEVGIRHSDIELHYNAAVVRRVQAECLGRALAQIVAGLAQPEATVAAICAPLARLFAPILESERGPARPEWVVADRLGELLSSGLAACRVVESEAGEAREACDSFHNRVMKRMTTLRQACAGMQQPLLGLVAPTCLEAAVTTVAALLAAIPVAFVDPRWPVERKNSSIARIGATVLVGTRQGLDGLSSSTSTHGFEDLAHAEARVDTTAAVVPGPASSEDIAYIVLSSGSTGTPKPIVVPRRSLQNQLLWLQERLPLTSQDVLLHRTPLGFDAAVWELLHPVSSGATLIIPRQETGTDPSGIAREVQRHSVSVLQLTPSLLRSIHEMDSSSLGRLRALVCGGDRLPCRLAADVLGGSGLRLLNAYGPSECCIQVTLGEVDPKGFIQESSSAPIGDPMPNSGMHVLGESLEPLLDGSTGRLFLAGCPVGHGYCADPAETAAAFIPLPDQVLMGERMYDTGDLARRVGNSIEILGRANNRLKINGVRIDLGAIEHCLRELQQVRDAAVLAVRDEYGTGYVTAFLVTDAAAAEVTTAARNRVGRSLPSTWQPAHYRCVSHLPMTDRGKVDSEALTKSAMDMITAPVVLPRTPLEQTIAAVWKVVLKRESVGIHDDFFLSGGHSLLFAQVITRLRQMLSLEISLRAIFMHPTIAQLAEHIEALQREGGRPDGPVESRSDSNGH